MTLTSPPSMTATTEFVVPRSMPMIFSPSATGGSFLNGEDIARGRSSHSQGDSGQDQCTVSPQKRRESASLHVALPSKYHAGGIATNLVESKSFSSKYLA